MCVFIPGGVLALLAELREPGGCTGGDEVATSAVTTPGCL